MLQSVPSDIDSSTRYAFCFRLKTFWKCSELNKKTTSATISGAGGITYLILMFFIILDYNQVFFNSVPTCCFLVLTVDDMQIAEPR